MKLRLLPLVALALAAGGCASSGSTVPNAEYPPTRPEDVVIYASTEEIPGDYDFLGFLSTPQTSSYGDSQARVDATARQQAAARGANAIVRISADDPLSDGRIRRAIARGGSAERSSMAAIYVFPSGPSGS